MTGEVVSGQTDGGPLFAGKVKSINLLEAIPVPFPDGSKLLFVEGEDGFPAFGFPKEHEVKVRMSQGPSRQME